MPIVGIYWDGNSGRDIHVLRGQHTRDLTQTSLKFRIDADRTHDVFAAQYFAQFADRAHADVTLTFTPLFKGRQMGDLWVGNNSVWVNTTNGSVTVDAHAEANTKNFVIEVTATNNGDPTHPFNQTIRIQVHTSVSQVWLTPDLLTVRPVDTTRPETSNYRFAVRAQFDDQVVGDLTEGHGVTWSEPGGHVDNNGALLILAGDNPGDNFFVAATLPAELGGASTSLGPTLRIGQRWQNETTPPKLTQVAGGGLPNPGTAEDSPNVLMLGDGFGIGDEDSFNAIVDTFIHHAKQDQVTMPFNLLSGRINFWRAFLPADSIGISIRTEVYVSDDDEVALDIPLIQRPPDHGMWSREQLAYVVGLPVAADQTRDLESLKAEWKDLLKVEHDPTNHITDPLILDWQNLAKRSFLEERDGFPGMSYGEPSAAASLSDEAYLHLHEDRAGVEGLQPFFSVLASDDITLANGDPVGRLWSEDTFRFHNQTLVVIISAFPGGRANNTKILINNNLFGYISVSTKGGSNVFPVKKVNGKNAYTLNMTAVPTAVEADRSRTVIHELGHSFGLGDEYAESQRSFLNPHASPLHANLQTEADTNDPGTGKLSGEQIPWVWHRIQAAAVVNGDITPDPASLDSFRIPLAPDVSFRFAKGDTVLLRPRTWGTPLRKFQPLEISGDLIITQDPASDAIVVRAIHAISAQSFPVGSLLYKPKPAPPQVKTATYSYEELVAKNIKDAITTNAKPLTEVPCLDAELNLHDLQIPIFTDFQNRTPVAGISLDPFLEMIKVVGLYSGGAEFSCGIFHPTGRCIMRRSHEENAAFCAVCRYIMVDMIAPEFHAEIDAEYERLYAQTLGTLNG